jgi:hypothetical protein
VTFRFDFVPFFKFWFLLTETETTTEVAESRRGRDTETVTQTFNSLLKEMRLQQLQPQQQQQQLQPHAEDTVMATTTATTSSSPPPSGEAPPKQVALAMDRLGNAARLIADIRLGADRLLEALFVAAQPHQSTKPLHLFLKEDSSMRQHLQDLRSVGTHLQFVFPFSLAF